jgi:uncharacterized protein (TIGR01777 family)
MDKEVVLITGGTGLVGKVLKPMLETAGYQVIMLSRSVKNNQSYLWDIEKNFIDKEAIVKCDHLIHLAGSGIADKSWTDKRKKEIINSRTDSSELLLQYFQQQGRAIKTVVAASAVGFYGSVTGEKIYTEADENGKGFLAETCVLWEKATQKLANISERLVQLRIGIVLDKNGGALKKLAQPVYFYAGAALGSGKQYMPWIHVYDLCNMILFAIQNKQLSGVFNAVSSSHTNNEEFTKAIGSVLHRPVFLPAVPAFVLQMFLGEMSQMVLEGSKISNEKIKKAGFKFRYDKVDDALKAIYQNN